MKDQDLTPRRIDRKRTLRAKQETQRRRLVRANKYAGGSR